MENYVVLKNAIAHHLFGNNIKDAHFVPVSKNSIPAGKVFKGNLVFVRTADGFIPVVKTGNFYYLVGSVRKVSDNSMPRAGTTGVGKGKPFGLQAGQIQGNLSTAPRVAEMASDINGNDVIHYRYPSLEAGYINTPEQVDYSESYPQYTDANFSGADGDAKLTLWEKMFGTKESRDAKAMQKQLDAKKELTVEEMAAVHKASGTNTAFKDWLKTDTAKDLAFNTGKLLNLLTGKKLGKGDDSTVEENEEVVDDTVTQSTILGMKPMTLGIVVLVSAAAIIGGIVIYKKYKK